MSTRPESPDPGEGFARDSHSICLQGLNHESAPQRSLQTQGQHHPSPAAVKFPGGLACNPDFFCPWNRLYISVIKNVKHA